SSYILHVCSVDTCFLCFFFNDPATTEIYTLSLHDALPIFGLEVQRVEAVQPQLAGVLAAVGDLLFPQHRPDAVFCGCEVLKGARSEEHTSELQSRENLVCRLLLEKKKKTKKATDKTILQC